jgi:hypothetical protein
MFRILLLCLLFTASFSAARCQTTHRDSVLKAARADARDFRLDDAIWKKYKRGLPATSDYFKPFSVKQGDKALLTDSVYVQAYRKEAFKRNKHRRTPWHYVLVGGSVAAGVVVLGIAAILIFVAPHMG